MATIFDLPLDVLDIIAHHVMDWDDQPYVKWAGYWRAKWLVRRIVNEAFR